MTWEPHNSSHITIDPPYMLARPRFVWAYAFILYCFRRHVTTTAAAAAASPSSAASASRSSIVPIPRTIRDFVSGIIVGMSDPPPRLGDVWATVNTGTPQDTDNGADDGSTGAEAHRSFAAGDIKSIDLPRGPSEPSTKRIRVCFRNLTPELLTLCWMSYDASPCHFYRLDPVANIKGDGDHTPSIVSMGHTETTSLGHAFLVAKRTSNHENKQVAGGRDGDSSAPPPSKRWRDCLTLCGSKRRHRDDSNGEDAMETSSKRNDGRCISLEEVVGGYRPTRVSLQMDSSSAGDSEHRIHVVKITRHRDPRHGLHLRGRGRRWQYRLEVGEEMLDQKPIDTSDKVYRCIELGGWPVRCEDCLWRDEKDNSSSSTDPRQLEEEAKLKRLIADDLAAAIRHLPPAARNALKRNTPIYINRSQKFGPKCAPIEGRDMCFHPHKKWVVENGMSEKKAGCVEIYRVGNYSRDCHLWGPGGVLLHELSHAYHHKCLEGGYDNGEVKECYDHAMEKGLYDKVKVHNLKGTIMCRAYACTNQMEYFAELSAAFLGGLDDKEYNKWYPFNRKQIKEHDPKAYIMLKRVWMVEDET